MSSSITCHSRVCDSFCADHQLIHSRLQQGGAPLPVKNALLPVANKEELRIQFPVSSGSQHREKATEWVPVSPKKDNMV